MAVNWLKEKETTGSATLTNNYVMTSSAFKDKFINCYSAIIGVDDVRNIHIKPISLDEFESIKYKDNKKITVNVQKSFLRFGNTKMVEELKSILAIDIPKDGIKGKTSWNEKDNCLVINFKGGDEDE